MHVLTYKSRKNGIFYAFAMVFGRIKTKKAEEFKLFQIPLHAHTYKNKKNGFFYVCHINPGRFPVKQTYEIKNMKFPMHTGAEKITFFLFSLHGNSLDHMLLL